MKTARMLLVAGRAATVLSVNAAISTILTASTTDHSRPTPAMMESIDGALDQAPAG